MMYCCDDKQHQQSGVRVIQPENHLGFYKHTDLTWSKWQESYGCWCQSPAWLGKAGQETERETRLCRGFSV